MASLFLLHKKEVITMDIIIIDYMKNVEIGKVLNATFHPHKGERIEFYGKEYCIDNVVYCPVNHIIKLLCSAY